MCHSSVCSHAPYFSICGGHIKFSISTLCAFILLLSVLLYSSFSFFVYHRSSPVLVFLSFGVHSLLYLSRHVMLVIIIITYLYTRIRSQTSFGSVYNYIQQHIPVVLHFLPPPCLQSSWDAAGRDDPGSSPAVFLLLPAAAAANRVLPSTAGRFHAPGTILASVFC